MTSPANTVTVYIAKLVSVAIRSSTSNTRAAIKDKIPTGEYLKNADYFLFK